MFTQTVKSNGQVNMSVASNKSNKSSSAATKNALFYILLVAISVAVLCIAAVQAEHHEDHKHHKFNPYKYGYKVIDHKGNKQWKQEESHSPMEVKGSYGYKDKSGMFREVSYIADKHGFRAHVKTNEPGTAPKSSAGVKMDAHPDPAFYKSHHGHESSHGHH